MIFMLFHMCVTYSIGKRRLWPIPKQHNNTNINLNDLRRSLTMVIRKKAPAANLEGNNKSKKYDCSLLLTIFDWKMAPAAALRHDKNEVQQTSPYFTGLHRTSPAFTLTPQNS